MAIKRGDVQLGDEEREAEETDAEKQEREDRVARDQELADARAKQQEADLRAARAEGEAEALRRGVGAPVPPAQTALSDAQWQELEASTGKTRQQIMADAQLSRATAEEALKPLKEMLAETQKELAETKEAAKRAKDGTSLYAVERDFYEKNPGLVGHRGEVEAFLAKFPENVRHDPAKLKDLLSDAKTFVRGKIRDERLRDAGKDPARRASTGRPEFADDPEVEADNTKLDLSDLDNDGAKRLVENLARQPGGVDLEEAPPAIDEVSVGKAYELSERKDGRGVSIDERGEFARGQRRADRGLRDPREKLRTSEDERERRGEVAGRR